MRHIISKTIKGPTSSSRPPKTRRRLTVQINRLICLGSVMPGMSILPGLWLHCFSVRSAVLSSCFRDITWFIAAQVTQRCQVWDGNGTFPAVGKTDKSCLRVSIKKFNFVTQRFTLVPHESFQQHSIRRDQPRWKWTTQHRTPGKRQKPLVRCSVCCCRKQCSHRVQCFGQNLFPMVRLLWRVSQCG